MFQFRLCLALGIPHPEYLYRLLTPKQIYQWMAFYAADPWGEWRQDVRQAMCLKSVAAAFSKEVQPPNPTWPYVNEPVDWEALRKQQQEMDVVVRERWAEKGL